MIFILGKGRSGSTVLDATLGAVQGVFNVGEFIYLWTRGLSAGWRCGCGIRFPKCPVWKEILDVANGTAPIPTTDRGLRIDRRVTRYFNAPRFLIRRPGAFPYRWQALNEWAAFTSAIYRGVAEVGESDVIVDASKLPVYPPAFGFVPGIEPYVVHLVRDPRAVAFSFMRRKKMVDKDEHSEMPRHGSIYSGITWTLHNTMAEAARARLPAHRSMLLRYEDLVRHPRRAVERILDLVDAADRGLPFIDDRTAVIGPNHSVGGNPDRLGLRRIDFREDAEWRSRLGSMDTLATTTFSAPLLPRYGYPIVPR